MNVFRAEMKTNLWPKQKSEFVQKSKQISNFFPCLQFVYIFQRCSVIELSFEEQNPLGVHDRRSDVW